MRVYLTPAMTSPNRELAAIQDLARALEANGLEVLTKHVAGPKGKEHDPNLTDHELAKRDLDWPRQANCLVAKVSTPSHGVGIEVMAAVQRGLPVLLLAREKTAVSRLLRGLPGVRFSWYRDGDDAVRDGLSPGGGDPLMVSSQGVKLSVTITHFLLFVLIIILWRFNYTVISGRIREDVRQNRSKGSLTRSPCEHLLPVVIESLDRTGVAHAKPPWTGDALMFAAAFSWALYRLLADRFWLKPL